MKSAISVLVAGAMVASLTETNAFAFQSTQQTLNRAKATSIQMSSGDGDSSSLRIMVNG
eukprot:CAMPEP_0113391914 /NCGR_PEP_ID=MMETSP0013_2-20120614/10987_1 /TAXON_ID=2843 ORGANISM="Skeletonema costatum, Strain 1716" /NCGR_SAMPLE_ID=MMETSP0013_2 /ASSEMBLY_ACC=CAM_ASM_000158 /LENGTH=58 /DNA_ID=CAMNT_0000275235 /DNA_START=58 /DNA_END=230 /DNA_ORIENTATION=- /assembly_acc=CAM_ASM_000158